MDEMKKMKKTNEKIHIPEYYGDLKECGSDRGAGIALIITGIIFVGFMMGIMIWAWITHY